MSQNLGSKNAHFELLKLHPGWIPNQKQRNRIDCICHIQHSQSHYGLDLSLEMTCMRTLIRQESQTTQDIISTYLVVSQDLVFCFLSGPIPSESGLYHLHPAPPCSAVYGSFCVVNMSCIYIQHLWY